MSFTFNPHAHVRTHSFRYTVDSQQTIRFLRFPVLFSLLLFLLFSIPLAWVYSLQFLFFNLIFWLFLSLGNILLMINYYRADRDKVLILSKGQDEFWFGTSEHLTAYLKKDIQEIKVYQNEQNKLWGSYSLYEITCSNGDVIYFSSILVSDSEVRNKFTGLEIQSMYQFFPRYQS